MPYIGTSPTQGVRVRYIYTATSSQTAFSGADANGVTLRYQDEEYVDVYKNGLILKTGTDYTLSNNTTMTLASGASNGDKVAIVVYDVFNVTVDDAYTKSTSDSRFINVAGDSMTGVLTVPDGSARNPAGLGSKRTSAHGGGHDPRPAREQMEHLLDECRQALGGWLSGMTLSATTVFLLTWGGLLLMKAPLALLSDMVCGLLTFLPTIGPTAATLLPTGLALLQSPQLMVSVLVFRLVLQNLEAFLLTPLLLRKTVNLLPTVALTAQLSLGALLGLPGVLLALPLVVVLQVLMQRVVVQQIMDRWA